MMAKEQRKKVNQNIKYNMAFKMTSPLKHAPYAKAHKEKAAHPNTAEAHGKKTEDYYDGSKGKPTGGNWNSNGTKVKKTTK